MRKFGWLVRRTTRRGGSGTRRALKTCCLIFLLSLIGYWIADKCQSASDLSDADLLIDRVVGSSGTNSAAFVLPERDTVIQNPQSLSDTGNGSSVFALFIVISAPGNIQARNVIRSGFKSFLDSYNYELIGNPVPNPKRNVVLFFVGFPGGSLAQVQLLNEAEMYGDMIIEDLDETYLNLTLKTLRMLKWVEKNCNEVEFTVKIDDDFHLNLWRFLGVLLALSGSDAGKNLIGGEVYRGQIPIRDPSSFYGKSYTPLHLWAEDVFPDFLAGFFYVIGKEARKRIYEGALANRLFHLEDVFVTGIIANRFLGMNLTDLSIISNFWTPLKNVITSSCDIQQRYIGIHFHSTMFNYLECWKNFNAKNFVCDNEWPLFTYCWFN